MPTYTVEEISRVLALGIIYGYNKLSEEDSKILDTLADNLFILDDKIGGNKNNV